MKPQEKYIEPQIVVIDVNPESPIQIGDSTEDEEYIITPCLIFPEGTKKIK